jgi:hypothetical protein
MLDDLHPGCSGVGHIVPQNHKKLLHSSHFCQIFCHLIVVAAVLLLYLFCHELRVSSDEKSPNVELLGQLKPGNQHLVFYSVVGGKKPNLNRILSPSGGMSTTSAPAPFRVYNPSKYIIQ